MGPSAKVRLGGAGTQGAGWDPAGGPGNWGPHGQALPAPTQLQPGLLVTAIGLPPGPPGSLTPPPRLLVPLPTSLIGAGGVASGRTPAG